ncbi:MAG: septum formation initiator family protein [Acidimicrobiales bacterium]
MKIDRDSSDGRKEPSAPPTRMQRRKAIRRRQARVVMITCAAFCVIVLATSFPAAALLHQRNAISGDKAELAKLQAGNVALERQAVELSQPGTVSNLAHRDYDMVKSGSKAYTVLPAAGSDTTGSSDGRSSLNQGPIAPGSSQSVSLVDGSAASPPAGASHSRSTAAGHGAFSPGLWDRVLDTLEFWR